VQELDEATNICVKRAIVGWRCEFRSLGIRIKWFGVWYRRSGHRLLNIVAEEEVIIHRLPIRFLLKELVQ
jgi:hypothetical protein